MTVRYPRRVHEFKKRMRVERASEWWDGVIGMLAVKGESA